MNKLNNNESRDIKIARIAFIGATIATIGDGIAAYAAALALDALENPLPETETRSSENDNLERSQDQINYYINELIHIRDFMK